MENEVVGYVLAALSSLFFSLYVVPKKFVKEKPMYYMAFMSLGFTIISVVVFSITKIQGINKENLISPMAILIWIRGICWVVASNFFLSAIDKIGMSRATQYKNLKGPIGVFLTLVILSEFMITNVVYVVLAAILTFISAILFTVKNVDNTKIDKKGVLYAVISSAFLGINALIQKYATNCGFVYMQQLWQSISILTFSIVFLLIKDKSFKNLITISNKGKILAVIGGLLYYFATFFNNLAYKYLPASIAFTIINMSTVWAVLIGIFLFKEISFKKNWKRITAGILLTVIGVLALLLAKQ